jgi:predicted membrane protein
MTTAVLLWGLLFSSIGLGFFLYGKKQRAVVPLVCGLVLMIYPYFISNTILLVVIGVVITVIPYFLRL